MKETTRNLLHHGRVKIFLYLCGILIINVLANTCLMFETAYAGEVFSVNSTNEPLNEVLVKISKSTGYKIEISKSWADKPVTVSFKKMILEKGLREIMRVAGEPNYALVVNEAIKKVEIRIFDAYLTGQKNGRGAYVGTDADFVKRGKAAHERDLMAVNKSAPDWMTNNQPSAPDEITQFVPSSTSDEITQFVPSSAPDEITKKQ